MIKGGSRDADHRRRRRSSPCRPTSVRARWTTTRCSTPATYTTSDAERQGLRRNHRRCVLDRPGRRLRHARTLRSAASRRACCRRRRTRARELRVATPSSGYAVNSIAIEVPVSMLTRTGAVEAATSPAATIGVWATTSRPRDDRAARAAARASARARAARSSAWATRSSTSCSIGTGFKDRFSMDQPKNDAQFASLLPRSRARARPQRAPPAAALAIPTPPRTRPAAARHVRAADRGARHAGRPDRRPAAAQHRRAADRPARRHSRLGLLGGDPAGYPERPRAVRRRHRHLAAGRSRASSIRAFNSFSRTTRLGDGVNVNDAPYRTTFPYLAQRRRAVATVGTSIRASPAARRERGQPVRSSDKRWPTPTLAGGGRRARSRRAARTGAL